MLSGDIARLGHKGVTEAVVGTSNNERGRGTSEDEAE